LFIFALRLQHADALAILVRRLFMASELQGRDGWI
jgi:hypothetical protein